MKLALITSALSLPAAWLLRLSLTAASAVVTTGGAVQVSQAPAMAQVKPHCQQSPDAIAQKEALRKAAVNGDKSAQERYSRLMAEHAQALNKCRSSSATSNQGLWIRLYPCDARSGTLDQVFDRIVNRGYNQVYINVFYNSQVLLPANANPTPWPSALAGTSVQNSDLLAEAIRKGRARGLKVYAWVFSMNYGANYFYRADRQGAIARNGLGQTSLTASLVSGLSEELGFQKNNEAFVDPYSPQARQDYSKLLNAVLQRRPDGVLFDYIRYPRGAGTASVSSKVQDLWVYGDASRQVLLQRATNYRGRDLIWRYMNQGYLTGDDLRQVQQQYPNETEPLWQGRTPLGPAFNQMTTVDKLALLQGELWQLAVGHASQGVVDFLNAAVAPVQRAGIPAGAVFFPEGNQTVGQQGFDSRLQFWHRFPSTLEMHPMSYADCGRGDCIANQVQRVYSVFPSGATVRPVIAGIWQQPYNNRPPLEQQMQTIKRTNAKISSISHFAYSWQEPGSDYERKYCKP
jgi:hypothetical protein